MPRSGFIPARHHSSEPAITGVTPFAFPVNLSGSSSVHLLIRGAHFVSGATVELGSRWSAMQAQTVGTGHGIPARQRNAKYSPSPTALAPPYPAPHSQKPIYELICRGPHIAVGWKRSRFWERGRSFTVFDCSWPESTP